MKKFFLIIVLAVFVVSATVSLSSAESMKVEPGYSKAAVDLRMAMRKLWEDHITYTRTFIISAIGGLEDTGKAAERLLRNQDEIGAAIAPLYGDAAGKKLAALLRDHILIAADIVNAAKAGSNDGVAAGQKKWQENADEIAAFLSGRTPTGRSGY